MPWIGRTENVQTHTRQSAGLTANSAKLRGTQLSVVVAAARPKTSRGQSGDSTALTRRKESAEPTARIASTLGSQMPRRTRSVKLLEHADARTGTEKVQKMRYGIVHNVSGRNFVL